jgi:DNA polymerase III gamma/tau subunit
MFPDFFGNRETASALFALTEQERIPQTILLDGPDGIGKAAFYRAVAGDRASRSISSILEWMASGQDLP